MCGFFLDGLVGLGYIGHDVWKWGHFFFLEGIDIAGNVEVVVVFDNLLKTSQMGKLIHIAALGISVQDLLDVGVRHGVLVLALVKLLGSVDKVDTAVRGVTVLFENDDRRRNAGVKEDIGWQADHGVNSSFFEEVLTDLAFGVATEKNPMR